MRPDPLRAVDLWVVDATAKTRWIFVAVETEAGLRGTGEASLNGREAAVVDAAARIAPVALAMPDAAPDELPIPDMSGLPEAAALSALDQALGAAPPSAFPVYANVNRRTPTVRRPASPRVRDALAAGHRSITVAPFDEATADARVRGEFLAAIEPGLRRVAAVRDAIGPEARLMIDCHWRLDGAAASRAIEAAADLGVHWVECPLPETADRIAAIRALRATPGSLCRHTTRRGRCATPSACKCAAMSAPCTASISSSTRLRSSPNSSERTSNGPSRAG